MYPHYFRSTEAARNNELIVVKSPLRSYGYSICNTAQGKTFSWYRFKRDALQLIEDLRNCPNTPITLKEGVAL